MVNTVELKHKVTSDKGKLIKDFTPYIGILVLVVLFALTTGGKFLRVANLSLILKQSVIVMIGALGSAFVLSHGNIDFSIGGELALCCLISYYVAQINPYLLLPSCIIIGMLLSLFVSVVHVVIGVYAFVSGMCVMFIGKGIVQSVAGSGLIIDSMYWSFDTTGFYILVMIIMIAVTTILFNWTRIGRYNKLIGSNPRAALLSGINEKKYKILAFLISGFCVGVSSFLTMIRAGGLSAQTGQIFEMDCVIVLTLGGAPLSGGSGTKIMNAVIGAIIYFMLSNGLLLWGLRAEIIYIIKGILFLAIVSCTFDRNNTV